MNNTSEPQNRSGFHNRPNRPIIISIGLGSGLLSAFFSNFTILFTKNPILDDIFITYLRTVTPVSDHVLKQYTLTCMFTPLFN